MSATIPTSPKLNARRRRSAAAQLPIPVLHTVAEAAEACGTSVMWIYKQIETGHLKGVRLAGRVVRIRHEDLMAFIDGQGPSKA